jgi:hypothetical protein
MGGIEVIVIALISPGEEVLVGPLSPFLSFATIYLFAANKYC